MKEKERFQRRFLHVAKSKYSNEMKWLGFDLSEVFFPFCKHNYIVFWYVATA